MMNEHQIATMLLLKKTFPFLMTVKNNDISTVTINKTRIVEALVIGGILAIAGYVFFVPIMKERLDTQATTINELKNDVKEIRRMVTDHMIKGN